MRKHILPIIARANRFAYIEPFGGGAAVLLAKPYEPNEVYNDVNSLLTNFFTQIRKKETVDAFQRLALTAPYSRDIFAHMRDLAKAWKNDGETFAALKKRYCFDDYSDETTAAFAYWYAMQTTFGGKPDFSTFGASRARRLPRKEHTRAYYYRLLVDALPMFQERLKSVVVENLPFEKIFDKYDNEDALFYCDPPYDVECSKDYLTDWNEDRSRELVEICASTKGGIVLSCYDSAIYQPLLKAGFRRETFKAMMSICSYKKKEREERVETVYFRFKERA